HKRTRQDKSPSWYTQKMKDKINIFYTNDWSDYEMLDTGEGEKLERFGQYIFARPYEDATWAKTLPRTTWADADGQFMTSKSGEKSGWKMKNKSEKKFTMSYKDISFISSPTPFRHLGFFPEQASHWDFIEEKIKKSGRKIKF